MIKVSVVVPIYNAEKTLIRCLESLLMQTLQEIEIICVDDCSTDNTFAMLQMIESEYPDKITLIKNDKNRGPGGARNTGLNYARGEYIGFTDIDDEVAQDMFEKLYNRAKEIDCGYDMVECGMYNKSNNSAIIYASDSLCGELNSHKRNELISCGGYVYTKIYKKSFLDSLGLSFRENIILEDAEYVAYTYATAKNIANVCETLYYYDNTNNSLSKQKDYIKNYNACFEAMKALYSRLSQLDEYEEISVSIEYAMVQLYIFSIIYTLLWYKEDRINRQAEAVSLLKALQDFSNSKISIPYSNNKYIANKIKNDDLNLAVINDQAPEKLINMF